MSENKIKEILSEVKKIQGINHNEFDTTIKMWIESAVIDLKSVGIVDTSVDKPDRLVQTAIITYVLSFLDTSNEAYKTSYYYQKDALRHTSKYSGEFNEL